MPAADCDRFLSLIKAGAFSPIFRKLILRLNVAKSSSSLYINPNYRIVTIIWSDTVYNMMIEELSFLLLTKFRVSHAALQKFVENSIFMRRKQSTRATG